MMNIINLQFINFFTYYNGVYTIGINSSNSLQWMLYWLKFNSQWAISALLDITSIDTLNLKDSLSLINTNSKARFLIVYNFISCSFNYRIQFLVSITEKQMIKTISNLYAAANWLEREIWDMFGIKISNQRDLRRILSDYGFIGHPLRKDFPLTGFLEIFYNDSIKRILFRPVSLGQGLRVFKFNDDRCEL